MNGGRATSVARRAVAPESAPRPRREAAERARARERQEPAALVASAEQAPTTRDRMEASFGAGASRLRRQAMRVIKGGAQPAQAPVARPVAPPVAGRMTTRDRIVNRALASPEPGRAAGSATVLDLAAAQSRRERQPAGEAAPDGTSRPLAPVIVLPVGPTLARPPPEAAAPEPAVAGPAAGDVVAAGTSARGPPGAGPVAEAAAGLADVAAVPEDAVVLPDAEAAVAGGPPGAELEAAPGAPAAGGRAVRRGVIRNPEDEPGFQAMKERAQQAGVRAKKHQPGKEGAATAQGASEPNPEMDIASQAAREQEEAMGLAEPGAFDPVAFKADVKKAVEGMAPPETLEEADEFKKSGKAGGAAGEIHVLVAGGKETSEEAIETATKAPPDLDKTPKPVSKMINDASGTPTPDVGAAAALPGIRPQWMIDLSGGPLLINAKLAEAGVTDEQLASANEPSFTEVLDTREEVREHAATAPGEYRAQEEVVLARGRADAADVVAGQLQGIHAARTDTLGAALGVKQDTKSADQELRDGIHQSIIDIHDRTQTDVMAILATLDTTVDAMFTAGEKAARDEFERYVAEKMRAYKADRYSGGIGKLKWLKDKIWDLPGEVNAFYRDGRTNYLAAMDRLIDVIAITVGLLLALAHARILMGREEVRSFVAGLDESVQSLGAETAADLDNRFDQLASDVDAKRDELVDAVARKYVESRDALDERIEELKEANKGLVKKAIDAAIRVIKTIAELTKLLFRVLLKAASAIGDIVAHPIRFLESLVGAVKGGLERFVSRIGTHLQNSLLDLLFGELGKAGITMPGQLDFAGILDLVLQVLGLTYASLRERVVKRFGEPVVARMEETVDVFKTLVKDGVAGLWTWIREKLTDLEDLVVGKIKTYVIERVVGAGIGYIMALLNPAAAFIKACQTIYKIVMFVVERAKQIADFVDAILDSIGAIARGDVGGAIEKIESALAGGLTLAINFLARLANLGALSEKIRSIINLVRKPIMRVVDGIVFGAGEIFRRTLGPALAFGKEKVRAGREWASAKIEAGRSWAIKQARSAKTLITGRELARAPPADAETRPADETQEEPIRFAEDVIEVAPGERHTVFAQLAVTGEVDLGMTSETQLILDTVEHLRPRIETLPKKAPARLPRGGQEGDQPRHYARSAAERILARADKLDGDLERHFVILRRGTQTKSLRSAVAANPAPANLTAQLPKLAKDLQILLRMFYAYDKPTFALVEGEPVSGQKLSARVWVRPDARGEILPEGGRRGIDPARARQPGFDILEPDPRLEAPTRGEVRGAATQLARGVVYAPAVGAGGPEVVVRSWAIGGTPHGGATTSHTEAQLFNWLAVQGEEFHQRITAIEVRSGYSPCGGCTETLAGIARLIRKRPPGVRPPSLIVFWDTVYGKAEGDTGPADPTAMRHVAELKKAYWIVHGPMPPSSVGS